jgi:hypothetical protein
MLRVQGPYAPLAARSPRSSARVSDLALWRASGSATARHTHSPCPSPSSQHTDTHRGTHINVVHTSGWPHWQRAPIRRQLGCGRGRVLMSQALAWDLGSAPHPPPTPPSEGGGVCILCSTSAGSSAAAGGGICGHAAGLPPQPNRTCHSATARDCAGIPTAGRLQLPPAPRGARDNVAFQFWFRAHWRLWQPVGGGRNAGELHTLHATKLPPSETKAPPPAAPSSLNGTSKLSPKNVPCLRAVRPRRYRARRVRLHRSGWLWQHPDVMYHGGEWGLPRGGARVGGASVCKAARNVCCPPNNEDAPPPPSCCRMAEPHPGRHLRMPWLVRQGKRTFSWCGLWLGRAAVHAARAGGVPRVRAPRGLFAFFSMPARCPPCRVLCGPPQCVNNLGCPAATVAAIVQGTCGWQAGVGAAGHGVVWVCSS